MPCDVNSLAFRLLKSVKEELGSDEAWKELIDTRCLGLLTKVDKELEPRDSSSAIDYNRKAAKKLRESLMCEEHPAHLDRWPWVAVLNPNPNEQLQVRRVLCSHRSHFDSLADCWLTAVSAHLCRT